MDKRTELVALSDALTAGGVAAAVDPRDLTPPGAWVHLGPWVYDRLSGVCVSATMLVDLIATDAGTWDALGQLDALEDDAVTILGPPWGQVLATTVTLPDSSAVLPCYRLTYEVELT
jgi:hypothetical protein